MISFTNIPKEAGNTPLASFPERKEPILNANGQHALSLHHLRRISKFIPASYNFMRKDEGTRDAFISIKLFHCSLNLLVSGRANSMIKPHLCFSGMLTRSQTVFLTCSYAFGIQDNFILLISLGKPML